MHAACARTAWPTTELSLTHVIVLVETQEAQARVAQEGVARKEVQGGRRQCGGHEQLRCNASLLAQKKIP